MRRLDNIDLRLLRVFVKIAESGGFGDAQIALNLSKSTLSTHLADLERRLGGQLCERGRKGFRLTAFGEATLAASQRLFADIDAFRSRVGRNRGELVGRLRIGIVDGVVTSPILGLQTVLQRFIGQAREVFVDLELGTPHDLEQAIAEGRRDVVIGPFSQKAPGVTYVPLHRETHGLYCGRDHPLFDVPARALGGEAIETALFSVRSYRQLDDLYRVNHPRASASVIHMEAQLMLLLSGQFIGFLPNHIAQAWVEKGMLRMLKPEAYSFESQHFAALRKGEQERGPLRLFVQELKRQADAGVQEKPKINVV